MASTTSTGGEAKTVILRFVTLFTLGATLYLVGHILWSLVK